MHDLIITLNKLLSYWWVRIIFFFGLNYFIYLFFQIFDLFNHSPFLFLAITLILANIIIEMFRAGSKWYAFGFHFSKRFFSDFLIALTIVCSSFGIIIGISFVLGCNLSFTYNYHNLSQSLEHYMDLFLLAASEELLFRGIIFQALIDRFNPYIMVFIFSFLFSVAHSNNPNFSMFAVFNIFLANLLMSVMYIQTRSLWLPIFYHYLWNLSQVLLGIPVSGYAQPDNLYTINTKSTHSAYSLIIGGKFGIEEGLLTTMILIISIYFIFRKAKPNPYITSVIFRRRFSESILNESKI
ncbi:MAG: family intrarane metalloprotease [Ignavibacteria bacterium]|nr:family intrarane metalloprotease [Ignavibacteria bacterium]